MNTVKDITDLAEKAKQDTVNLVEQWEATKRELLGTQEMLGRLLQTVGQPVLVSAELLAQPFPVGAQIRIDDHTASEEEELRGFLFYLEYPDGSEQWSGVGTDD